jgi:hypothetical protein
MLTMMSSPVAHAGLLARQASPPLSLSRNGGIRVETAPTSIFSERPIATAIAIGIATLIPHLFLSTALSLALAAIVMGMVAGVYFGFAVVRGNNFQQQIEFNVTLLFLVAALLGVWVSPWFIPAAFLAHGLWDFAHHNNVNSRLVSIPQWYIPWCVVIDVILGVGLIVLWHWNGVL